MGWRGGVWVDGQSGCLGDDGSLVLFCLFVQMKKYCHLSSRRQAKNCVRMSDRTVQMNLQQVGGIGVVNYGASISNNSIHQ